MESVIHRQIPHKGQDTAANKFRMNRDMIKWGDAT